MASRASVIFVFACFLLVASEATALKKEMAYGGQPPLKPPCDHPATPAPSSPANATSQTPTKPPTSSPAYPTPQTPSHHTPSPAPTVAPTPHVPATAPAYVTPPTAPAAPSSRNPLRYCVPQCQQRCIMLRDEHKILRNLRPCVHVCTACCAKTKPSLCVPGRQTTCPVWDSVPYHGAPRQCP